MLELLTAVWLPTVLQASGGGELTAWEIAIVAFAFVAYILIVASLLERWEDRLHA